MLWGWPTGVVNPALLTATGSPARTDLARDTSARASEPSPTEQTATRRRGSPPPSTPPPPHIRYNGRIFSFASRFSTRCTTLEAETVEADA